MPRTRNDSIAGKQKILENANTQLEPIKKLTAEERDYFDRYAKCRPVEDWSPGDILRLERLCGWLAEADELTQRIKAEGPVVLNQRGTPIGNPLFDKRDNLERMAMSAEAKLHLYSPTMNGSGHKRTADKAKEIESVRKNNVKQLLA